MRTSLQGTLNVGKEPLLLSGVVAGLILLLGWGSGSQFVFPGKLATRAAASPPAASVDADTQRRVATTMGQLPLLFIENRGQLDPQVVYYVQGRTNTLYFTPTGITFALTGPVEKDIAAGETAPPLTEMDKPVAGLRKINHATTPQQRWVVNLDFLDANPQVKPQAEAPQKAIISYFKGKPEDWQTGLKTYGQLRYPNL